MNSSGHLPVSEKAARRVRKAKNHHRKTRGRNPKNNGTGRAEKERVPAAIGSLTRTKALLLAALRVWELKHRVGE